MKTNKRAIFQQLDPPSGGVQAIADRMVESPVLRPWFWHPTTAIATMALLVVAAVFYLVPEQGSDLDSDVALLSSADFDRLLGRPVEPFVTQISLNGKAIPVVELETSASGVRLYKLD